MIKKVFAGFMICFYFCNSLMAGVAQLVESQIVALVVAGSSPVPRPRKGPWIVQGPFHYSLRRVLPLFFANS